MQAYTCWTRYYYSNCFSSGQLQPLQQHTALCERNRCFQAVPLLRGGPETKQCCKGWVHQFPVPHLGVRAQGDRWHRHWQTAGVWVWRPAKRDQHDLCAGPACQVRKLDHMNWCYFTWSSLCNSSPPHAVPAIFDPIRVKSIIIMVNNLTSKPTNFIEFCRLYPKNI